MPRCCWHSVHWRLQRRVREGYEYIALDSLSIARSSFWMRMRHHAGVGRLLNPVLVLARVTPPWCEHSTTWYKCAHLWDTSECMLCLWASHAHCLNVTSFWSTVGACPPLTLLPQMRFCAAGTRPRPLLPAQCAPTGVSGKRQPAGATQVRPCDPAALQCCCPSCNTSATRKGSAQLVGACSALQCKVPWLCVPRKLLQAATCSTVCCSQQAVNP